MHEHENATTERPAPPEPTRGPAQEEQPAEVDHLGAAPADGDRERPQERTTPEGEQQEVDDRGGDRGVVRRQHRNC